MKKFSYHIDCTGLKKQFYLAMAASCLALALAFFIASIRTREEALASSAAPSLLRFHVLANSDSPEDQELKLQVRDQILKEIRQGVREEGLLPEQEKTSLEHVTFRKKSPSQKARLQSYIQKHEKELEKTAEEFMAAQGFSYTADIRLESAYFPTRFYGDLVLPCGTYDAVRVMIGEGKGHNWWCVLYPSLCFTSESFAVMPPSSEEELSCLLDESLFEELHKDRTIVFGESLGRRQDEKNTEIQKNGQKDKAEKTSTSVQIDFYFLRWLSR